MSNPPQPDDLFPWAEHHLPSIPDVFPAGKKLAIEHQGLVYGCALNVRYKAKGLVVWLWGSTGRHGRRPMLMGREFGDAANMHTLVISDPSLLLDPELITGVFLGSEDRYPIDGIVEIASRVALFLGLDPRRTIFAGGSSGGFAAILAASRMGAGAVSINSQMDLPQLRGFHAASILLNRYAPGSTADSLEADAPLKMNAGKAVLAARAAGRRPQLVVIQNIKDVHHYRRHYEPFCALTHARFEGGVSDDGDILTIRTKYAGGHATSPEALELAFGVGATFLYKTLKLQTRAIAQGAISP